MCHPAPIHCTCTVPGRSRLELGAVWYHALGGMHVQDCELRPMHVYDLVDQRYCTRPRCAVQCRIFADIVLGIGAVCMAQVPYCATTVRVQAVVADELGPRWCQVMVDIEIVDRRRPWPAHLMVCVCSGVFWEFILTK